MTPMRAIADEEAPVRCKSWEVSARVSGETECVWPYESCRSFHYRPLGEPGLISPSLECAAG